MSEQKQAVFEKRKESEQNDPLSMTKTFQTVGLFSFVAFGLLTAFLYFKGRVFLTALSLGFVALSLQGALCFFWYLLRDKKKMFCFSKVFYRPLGWTIYAFFTCLIVAFLVFLGEKNAWAYAVGVLPVGGFLYTIFYASFLKKESRLSELGATDYYLETIVTPSFFVNGVDIFLAENTTATNVAVPVCDPATGGEVGLGLVFLVKGKNMPFFIALAKIEEGMFALFLVTRRDYEKLCVVEGLDEYLLSDRKQNQRAFEKFDCPAFHEEGYFYTQERETRFSIEQEEGSFCVVEQALFWDRFFYRDGAQEPPYVWDEVGREYFEYYSDALSFLQNRIAKYNLEKQNFDQ